MLVWRYGHHFKVVYGSAVTAHAAGHPHTLAHVLQTTGANAPRHPQLIFMAVGRGMAMEPVALNHTLEPLTLRNPNHVHHVTRRKLRQVNCLTNRKLTCDTKLLKSPECFTSGLHVPSHTL
jgi:hypothetical protein